MYEGFVDLFDIAPIEAESFLEYLLDNYVRDNSQFHPLTWAAEPSDNPHTANVVESFNSHISMDSFIIFLRPNVYLFIDGLLGIQVSTYLLLNSI